MMILRKQRREELEEAGFTLVEMVVGIIVLGIIAVMALPFFARAYTIMSLNNSVTSATASAHEIVEQMRADPTCGNIESIVNASDVYQDSRGIYYRMDIQLPDGCYDGEAVDYTITAERLPDATLLLENEGTLYVPPIDGQFQLTPATP